MQLDRSLLGALGLAVVVAAAAFPWLGVSGSVRLAAVAFYLIVLIASGYRVVRALVWGGLIAGLFIAGVLLADGLGPVLYGAGALVFFVGALVPSFRRLWFDQRIE